MVKFDVATLGFFSALISIASGLIIGVVFHRRQSTISGANAFMLSISAYGFGVLMIALRGTVLSEQVGIMGGNFLVAVSGALLHLGTSRLLGRRFSPFWYLLAIALPMAGFLYFFYFNYNVSARIAVISAIRIPLLLHGCWLLKQNMPEKNRGGYTVLFWLCGIWLVWYAIRTGGAITDNKPVVDFLAMQGFQTFHFFLTGFGNVIITIALLRILDDAHLENVIRMKNAEREAQAAMMESERVKALSNRLVEIAHHAGMAEIAVGALHNIGNVLNSLSITEQVILKDLRSSAAQKMQKANELLKEKLSSPGDEALLQYYRGIDQALRDEQAQFQQQVNRLVEHTDLAKSTISELQTFAKGRPMLEPVDLAALLEEVLEVERDSIRSAQIEVVKKIDPIPVIHTSKGKLSHVLLNLVKNARESMAERHSSGGGVLTVEIRASGQDQIQMVVTDTGVGIDPSHLNQVFNYGFTTKKDGNGFGLHTSANSMTEIGGEIRAVSEGLGKGAAFHLRIPVKAQNPDILSGHSGQTKAG